MSEQGWVMGRWTKVKTRCHRCHRPVTMAYIVNDPPLTGTFCGRNCYQMAREEFENAEQTKEQQT